ncbi:MAG: acetate/propionate family kinase [Alphaproteobacteria bacterium]|nr:acetate/propionate family kinase [Alphaproteobacteria bacterium]
MTDAIVVINAGSSSVKFSVFTLAEAAEPDLFCKGQISGIGTAHARFVAKDATGQAVVDESDEIADHASAAKTLGGWLQAKVSSFNLVAFGHRVVHGGSNYDAPVAVDNAVMANLDALSPLAPLHQPHNLAMIRAVERYDPNLLQVACFDTSFHCGHADVVDRFAIPDVLHQQGVRRYGFHGLSYEYIARTLPEVAPEIAGGRVVVAHLGSGASMCAIENGRSVDSTLGFTALDGLPMGTRCGALDPGVLLYLIQEKQYDATDLERMLYHESGLKGISGISNDVRDLLASDEPMARLALDCFVYRINRELGALAAAMCGLDALVFTAGIGEHAAEIRARVCAKAAWLGIDFDSAANDAGGPRITTAHSKASAWVIPTDEEKMIALHTLDLLKQRDPAGAT